MFVVPALRELGFVAWDLTLLTQSRGHMGSWLVGDVTPFLSFWPVCSGLVVLGLAGRGIRRGDGDTLFKGGVLVGVTLLLDFLLIDLAGLREGAIAAGYGALARLVWLEFRRVALWRRRQTVPFVVFHAVRALSPSLIALGSAWHFADTWALWVWRVSARGELGLLFAIGVRMLGWRR